MELMMVPKKHPGRFFRLAILAILAAPLVYVLAVTVDLAPKPFMSKTEVRMEVTNLEGADFEITFTRLDAITNREYVSVFADKPGTEHEPPDKKANDEALLFRYDPSEGATDLPQIKSAGPKKVVISIPKVSAILFQRRLWNGLSVEYKIGVVEHP
jgi:hypothetical protein